jgi:hypothetical protein
MDFNATIDLIIKDLDDASNIIDDLKKCPGVPLLQVELAKAKCKSAGEVIALLKNITEQKQTTSTMAKTSEPVDKAEKETEPDTVIPHHKEPAVAESTQPSPVIPEVEMIIPGAEVSEPSQKTTRKVTESPRIADKFSHLSNRFNEQIGSKKGEDDLDDTINTKPLTSLTEAIGVNDRFLFIREIFDGNKEEYTSAILKLENVGSIKDARAIIMSYTSESEDNKAVKQLLNLVKRKLTPHE